MIYLVRHGETDWNLFQRFNGHTDVYLNRTGIAQAERLADSLKNTGFDACFCSPQTRARQFCVILYNGPVTYDARLAEIDCGEFEGTEETPEAMALFWQAVKTGDRGTERLDGFIQRNCAFCERVAEDYPGKNVLIVTHAANARVMDYYFKGKPKDYDFGQRVMEKGGMVVFEN